MSPDLEQMIAVPWKIEGLQVYGYAITRIGIAEEKELGYRQTHTHEFWIYDAEKGPVNLGGLYPNGYQLTDNYGNTVYLNEAFEKLDEFASAASYFPHVFMAPEFAEARNYLNAGMGLPPVTAEDYKNYLKHMEEQIGSSTFVGKITKASDMHLAYESMEGMEDYEKGL